MSLDMKNIEDINKEEIKKLLANKSITDSKTSKESLTNLFSNTYDILQ